MVEMADHFVVTVGACTGALKGAGLPTTASRINLFSYWMAGLPFGVLATIKMQKIEALWIGMSLAVGLAAISMLVKLWT